jgi:hypothetical protein
MQQLTEPHDDKRRTTFYQRISVKMPNTFSALPLKIPSIAGWQILKKIS